MKKYISCFIAVIMLLMLIITVQQQAYAEEIKTSRVINIVYDDSMSMVRNSSVGPYYEKWYRAKYAMEVFSAMLGKDDVMNIFPMSLEGTKFVTISGSETPEVRVEKIHNMKTEAASTPYSPVQAAYDDLKSVSNKDEEWLIIITDGAFNSVSGNAVQNDMESFVQENDKLKVAYLAIGQNTFCISSTSDGRVSAYRAADGNDILRAVTKMANKIFNQEALDANKITPVTNGADVQLDVPVEHIIVFAQGKDIEIGDINGLEKVSEINVSCTDIPPTSSPGAQSMILYDKDLSGVIATYKVNDAIIPNGNYILPLNDTLNLQIYYKPVYSLGMVCTKDGQRVDTTNTIQSGEYEIDIQLVNPINGDPIDSSMLQNADFSTTIENNGNIIESDEQKIPVEFEAGTVYIKSTADLPGSKMLFYNYEFEVFDPLGQVGIDTSKSVTEYDIKTLENGDCIEVSFTYDGAPMTKEYFDILEFDVNTVKKLNLDTQRDDENLRYLIYPKYIENDMDKTVEGKVDIVFDIKLEDLGQTSTDSQTLRINIKGKTIWEKHWKKFIIGGLIFALFLANMLKKRIKTRKFKPYWTLGDYIGTAYYKPKYLTYILPFVPNRGVISIDVGGTSYDLPFTSLLVEGVNRRGVSFRVKKDSGLFDESVSCTGISLIEDKYRDKKWITGFSVNTRFTFIVSGEVDDIVLRLR